MPLNEIMLVVQDIDKVRKEILQELNKREISLFFGTLSTEESFPTIYWDRTDDLKGFLDVAQKDGIKTMLLSKRTIDEKSAESGDRMILRYKGRQYMLQLCWIKDGIRFCFEVIAFWAKGVAMFAPTSPQETNLPSEARPIYSLGVQTGREFPKEFKMKKPEQLADEFFDFLRKEFPDLKPEHSYELREIERTFWETKGISVWNLDPQAKLIYAKLEKEIQGRITQQLVAQNKKVFEEEKKKLPKMTTSCAEWALNNGLRKVNQLNIRTFLAENGESLSQEIMGILSQMVNQKLPKTWFEFEKKELPNLVEVCVEATRKGRLRKVTKAIVKSYLAENEKELSASSIEILVREVNRNLSEF